MPKITNLHGRPVSGQMPGLVEAIVVDNVDPDQLGRVKLKFPLLPDMPESFWARLSMPMAGRERGWMTIPEINDEVLVSFVRGDINNAIVVGSLYNGVDTPPYANEDMENNLRVFQSRSGHRLTFDDTAGAERIELILHNEEILCTSLFLLLPLNSIRLIVRVGRFFVPELSVSSAMNDFILLYISSVLARLRIFSSIVSIAVGSDSTNISASLRASSKLSYFTKRRCLYFGS